MELGFMDWWGREAAKAGRIKVWWDMKDCPIPEGYDARRIRPSLEAAFKKLGYSGPVYISAYGDHTQAPGDLLRGLASTRVNTIHTVSKSRCAAMYKDMTDWRDQNPPPATMMIISDQVEDVFSCDLVRLQQRTQFNLFLAYSVDRHTFSSRLVASAHWHWEKLLEDNKTEPTTLVSSQSYPLLLCKSCNFIGYPVDKFIKHLKSYKHAREEATKYHYRQPHFVTTTWGRNYVATSEYATARILVWWNMMDCPIPAGYDARQVRPSLEVAFKKLGYSGPVSITAYGDQKYQTAHLLRRLSSTGVAVVHTRSDEICFNILEDLFRWVDDNPSPATIMVISDHVDSTISTPLVRLLQLHKYNLFLAYSFRPPKMSALLTSAEWLWESLLAVSETNKCSESETESESDMGESTATLCTCKPCYWDCKGLDKFMTHLSSQEHAQRENKIAESIASNQLEKKLARLEYYDQSHGREVENSRQSNRMRKAFRRGFRHVGLTNRGFQRRARKSQRMTKLLPSSDQS